MAIRRMFSQDITKTDRFTSMPEGARLLYFVFGMEADDDGFVQNPEEIIRGQAIARDNFDILIIKKFIIPFESGIIVIRHWKVNNYIRPDRYKPTPCQTEFSQLAEVNGEYQLIGTEISPDEIPTLQAPDTPENSGIHLVYPDKDRVEEERSEKNSSFYSLHSDFVSVSEIEIPTIEEVQAYCNEKGYTFDVQKFMRHNQKCNWRYNDGTPKNWRTNADQWQGREWNKFQKTRALPKPKPQPKPSESSEQSPYEDDFMKVWGKK